MNRAAPATAWSVGQSSKPCRCLFSSGLGKSEWHWVNFLASFSVLELYIGSIPSVLVLEASRLLGRFLRTSQMVPDGTIGLLALLPSTPSSKWVVVGPFIYYPLFLFAFSRIWSCAICPVFSVLWGKKYLNPSVLFFPSLTSCFPSLRYIRYVRERTRDGQGSQT